MTKTCSKCGKEKELDSFNRERKTKDGHRPECRECQRLFRNSKQQIACTREWRKAHSELLMLQAARQRSKKRGTPCTITKEDIHIPSVCPILGIPLARSTSGKRGARRGSPSLDRKDSSLGYVPGNIQVISHQANTMKNNATPEEILAFGKWAVRTYGVTRLPESSD